MQRRLKSNLLLSRVTWQSVIAASAVENRVFKNRDIIANAINRSAILKATVLEVWGQ